MGVAGISKSSMLILVLFCEIIGRNKIISHDEDEDKLNDCRRCKLLTDSFDFWLQKTSRGKYEGGDTAWEEAKLKSYSRSEVRLVEIQEGLCSEVKIHQDACYAIAEEGEQVLEKWWFTKDPVALDLYTWLCIETLKHCCPINRYGIACTPCPEGKNNKVCAGHGHCDGAGTRKGNGTCICKRGYAGEMCDECDKSFYLTSIGSCKRCHKACNSCSGEGAGACDTCKSGWQLQSNVCVDIDECELSVCEPHQYCTNKEGSYSCEECESSCRTCRGEGSSNCTSCERSNVLWFGMCVDNELKQNIIINTYKRLALYVGLLIITLFISRTSRYIASIVISIIAIFIYISERNLKMNTMDVLLEAV